jgi:hypothetical protein
MHQHYEGSLSPVNASLVYPIRGMSTGLGRVR